MNELHPPQEFKLFITLYKQLAYKRGLDNVFAVDTLELTNLWNKTISVMLPNTETDRCDEFVKTYSRKFAFQISNFRETLERKLPVKTLLENHQNHFKELQKLLNIDPGGHLPVKSRLELAMDVGAIVSNSQQEIFK